MWKLVVVAFMFSSLPALVQCGQVISVRLCGSRLADFLNFICSRNSGFHEPRYKRSALSTTPFEPPQGRQKAPQPQLPLSPSPDDAWEPVPVSKAGIIRLHRDGVVNECCKRQCTLATLATYCNGIDAKQVEMVERYFPRIFGLQVHPQIAEEQLELPVHGVVQRLAPLLQPTAPYGDTSFDPEGNQSTYLVKSMSTATLQRIHYKDPTIEVSSNTPRIGRYTRPRPYFMVVSTVTDVVEEDYFM